MGLELHHPPSPDPLILKHPQKVIVSQGPIHTLRGGYLGVWTPLLTDLQNDLAIAKEASHLPKAML